MLTFERLPGTKINGKDHYYFYMRSHDEFIISAEMSPDLYTNGQLDEFLEFLMQSTKGHCVVPIFLYLLWENLEPVRATDPFHVCFNSLADFMVFKLAYGEFILRKGVFTKSANDPFWDEFNPIEDVKDILIYRPNALIDIR